MMLSQWIKKILIMLGISVGSFIGFNVAFLLAAFMTLLVARFIGPIGHSIGRFIYLILVYTFFFIAKPLRTPTWFKAILFTIPIMSTLILIGVYGYGLSTPIILAIGAGFVGCWLYYMWLNKWDWTYFYAISFVSVCAAYVMIAGVDI